MNRDYTLQFAERHDVEAWMQLIQAVRANFPGLDTDEQLDRGAKPMRL